MKRGGRSRSVSRGRGHGTCKGCGREAAGVTTVERRPWADPIEHVYHYCDGCLDQVDLRPLEQILSEDFIEAAAP